MTSTPLKTQTGEFATEHASKYLQQLCKHFAHRVTVDYDAAQGLAQLGSGPARMSALPDLLRVEISGPDDAALERARDVIDSHLARFAFREDFTAMNWQPA